MNIEVSRSVFVSSPPSAMSHSRCSATAGEEGKSGTGEDKNQTFHHFLILRGKFMLIKTRRLATLCLFMLRGGFRKVSDVTFSEYGSRLKSLKSLKSLTRGRADSQESGRGSR